MTNNRPNRLISETSPYLLQHAYNPVEWYPWGEEALQRAKAENKVILVSIGYSACHWCHVMERESFENADTAAIMNEYFINIKIDREERPDLDQVYMDAVQTISGSGGWPLNCFLTPDAKPFYGGTYFPPVNAYNRSSWREVLHAINSAWRDKPYEIISQAENLTDHLSNAGLFGKLSAPKELVGVEQLATIGNNLLTAADKVWGGFGGAPKFPQTFSIQFLLRQHYFNKKKQLPANDALLRQALLSLNKMIDGGLYDQLQGGFARYSTDTQWLAPHFEKMLYDNALLINVISEAYQLTGNDQYAATIKQTMQFIADEWQDVDGGFFSAYDADSEGEEGKYYTWQLQEIKAIIPEPDYFELFCHYYDVSEAGNWEHTNILWVQQPLSAFCAERNLEEVKVQAIIDDCNKRLLKYRFGRIKPLLDDKKLLSWNALMITACCKAWAAIGEGEYLQMAEKAAAFIETSLKNNEGGYHHNYKDGKAANPAFLDDLANYTNALLHLQEITGNFTYLETAKNVTTQVLDAFADTESPFFFYTPANQTDIIFRKKDNYDGAVPSGNSIMAGNLLYLGQLLDIPEWMQKGEEMIGQMSSLAIKYPSSFGLWCQLLQQLVFGINELAVVGANHQQIAAAVLKEYTPDKILQHSAISNQQYPLLNGKVTEGDGWIYVCKNFACQRPVATIKEALDLMV